MKNDTPLLLECQMLLNATEGDYSTATLLNLKAHYKLLLAESKRNKLIDKGITLILGSVVGNAILPGIGLLAGPIASGKLSKTLDNAIDQKYKHTLQQLDYRIRKFGRRL